MAFADRHGYSASAAGPFENLVYDLTTGEGAVAAVERLGQDLAILRTRSGGVPVVVARYRPGVEDQLGEIMHALTNEGAEVVVIGGDEAARDQLASVRPTLGNRPVHLYHVTDDKKLWKKVGGLLMGDVGKFLETGPASRPMSRDWDAFWSRAQADNVTRQEKVRELGEFQAKHANKRRYFTWGLAFVLGVVFVLETVWGGSENGDTLVRMGALVPELIRAGEWWRLISCAFLHFGGMHFFVNTYVLVGLGGFLEGIIGARRLLTLWTLSAIGGSIASLTFGGGRISVGASGALWGILGAQAMLAFRPRGLLPEVMIPGAKRAALTNLALNVFVSFLPGIDAAAHFGGGAVGALLVLSGFLTAGMARKPKQVAFADDPLERDHPPFWITPVAAACALVLVAGLALALHTGRPWAR